MSFNYSIMREPPELKSPHYMEIAPSRYTGKHWQQGFLFVWEDAFAVAEGILAAHLPAYDHFSINDIPKDIGMEVIEEWQQVANVLHSSVRPT